MRCRKAFEVDLAAFLHDPADRIAAEFHAHAAECADCAAEAGAWAELDRALRGAAPEESHPSPDALLAFVDGEADVASADRGRVAEHLAHCRTCADEIAALRSFDFAAIAAPAAAQPPSPPDARQHARAAATGRPASYARAQGARRPERDATARVVARRGVGSRLRRAVLHPAFAYALVVVLLYPALRYAVPELGRFSRAPKDAASEPRLALESVRRQADAPLASAPAPALQAAPAAPPAAGVPDVERRAESGADPERLAELRGGAREADEAEMITDEPSRLVADARRALEADPRAAAEARPHPRVERTRYRGETESEARARTASKTEARRASETRGGDDRAAAKPDATDDAAAAVVTLRPGEPARVPLDDTRGGLVLRIAIPDASGGSGTREIRVVGPGGRKEMRERIDVAGEPASVTLRLPDAWLTKGEYVVEVMPVEGAAGPGALGFRTGSYAFAVR